MSSGYRAVQWSPGKRRYDLAVVGILGLYLATFVGVTLLRRPEITVETALIRAFGTAALLLLHLVLAIGPAARLDRVDGIAVSVAQVPFNFQVGPEAKKVRFPSPTTPEGELEVRVGSCGGEVAARLLLAPATISHEVTALPSAPIARTMAACRSLAWTPPRFLSLPRPPPLAAAATRRPCSACCRWAPTARRPRARCCAPTRRCAWSSATSAAPRPR